MNTEAINRAANSASSLLAELTEAYSDASALESIALLPLIERAAKLRAEVIAIARATGQS